MAIMIDSLTPEQEARMPEWVDKWIGIGLQTGDIDIETFTEGMQAAYGFAGVEWHDNVIVVDNPLVGALASPLANYILYSGAVGGAVGGAVRDTVVGAVGGAVDSAVDSAVDGAVGDTVGDTVGDAVGGAVGGAVDSAVGVAVRGAVDDAVRDAVGGAVDGAVGGAVDGAVRDTVVGAVRNTVVGAVDDAVGDAVRVAVDSAVRVAVGGAVGDAVGVAVGDAVGGAVGGAVDGAVRDTVVGAVVGAVRDTVVGAVDDAVRVAVDDAVGDAVRVAVDSAVRVAVRGAVRVAVRDAVGGAVKKAIQGGWNKYLGGQFWVGGWYYGNAYVTFFRDVCQLELSPDIMSRMAAYEKINTSACYSWPNEKFVMVCKRPNHIRRDANGRLHCEHGSSIEWNGFALYHWHGVAIPAEWVTGKKPSSSEALTWSNIEQRRAACEIVGWNNILAELNARVIDTDEDAEIGQLLEAEIPDSGLERFLKVRCATGRSFVLPVPREVQTALDANAWTFGLDKMSFKPEIRT